MAAGSSIAAESCTLSSDDRHFGAVAKDASGRMRPGLLSVYGCSFLRNMWAVAAGSDVSKAAEASLLRANSFTRGAYCGGHEPLLTRSYDDTNQGLQPWRRGWAEEA